MKPEGAWPEILTWLEAVSVAKYSNSNGVSVPHFPVGSSKPGYGFVAMWSNEIITDEIVDLEDSDLDDGDELEFDFNLFDLEDDE